MIHLTNLIKTTQFVLKQKTKHHKFISALGTGMSAKKAENGIATHACTNQRWTKESRSWQSLIVGWP